MLAEERKLKILDYIDLEGSVRVADLAKEFVVTTETVRRYLDELQREQKVKKVYGGAVRFEEKGEASLGKRETLKTPEKRRIAQVATSLISEGDHLFIDEGTTTLQMAESLCRFSTITIMTTSFPLAMKLMQLSFKGKLLFLGGVVQLEHARTAGSMTLNAVRRFRADKAFIVADAIHPHFGISCHDSDKSELAKLYMEQSQYVYVLADHSKLNKTAVFSICSVHQPNLLITDCSPSGEWKHSNWYVADQNVSVWN